MQAKQTASVDMQEKKEGGGRLGPFYHINDVRV